MENDNNFLSLSELWFKADNESSSAAVVANDYGFDGKVEEELHLEVLCQANHGFDVIALI